VDARHKAASVRLIQCNYVSAVMAGLVPAIHVFLPRRKAWMAATSAAMTIAGCEGAYAAIAFARCCFGALN
jgi:hypothetical protein